MIKEILYKLILPSVISKACDATVPRSGEAGSKVNCFITAFDKSGKPFFVAKEMKAGTLVGLKYDGKSYSEDYTLPISDLDDLTFRITHFYGLAQVNFTSIYDLFFHRLTHYIYLKIWMHRIISATNQYFFNSKKLVAKKRLELLQFMMDDQLERTHNGINSFDLMEKLYTINWISHPSGELEQEKLELYLDSLVQSGDLEQINDEYVVTGRTISTVEKHEEEERRHVEAVILQRKMFWLTVLILIVAIIQSGVIKLPVLLDLSQ